jgi:hypothetical protein
MLLLLAAQTSIVAPAEAERVIIDLTAPAPCRDRDDTGFGDDIVVCAEAHGQSKHRIAGRQGAGAGQGLPPAEVRLGDGSTLGAEAESADLGMARSQRLMVRWQLKF